MRGAELLVAQVHAGGRQQMQHAVLDAVRVEQLLLQEAEVGAWWAAIGRPGVGARQGGGGFRVGRGAGERDREAQPIGVEMLDASAADR